MICRHIRHIFDDPSDKIWHNKRETKRARLSERDSWWDWVYWTRNEFKIRSHILNVLFRWSLGGQFATPHANIAPPKSHTFIWLGVNQHLADWMTLDLKRSKTFNSSSVYGGSFAVNFWTISNIFGHFPQKSIAVFAIKCLSGCVYVAKQSACFCCSVFVIFLCCWKAALSC